MASKKRISTQLPFLLLLARAHPRQRSAILETSNSEQIKALSEIARNLLNGNLPITNLQKKKLQKYEKQLILLSDKKTGINKLKLMWIKNSKFLIPLFLANTLPQLTE